MRATQFATIAVVTMLLLAGVAALGAAAPAETTSENATAVASNPSGDPGDAADDRGTVSVDEANASDQRNAGANAENASNATVAQGPDTNLPATVPDHVSQIHGTIVQYLDGDIENLGHALGDLLSGEAADAGNDSAPNAPVDPANASAADDATESAVGDANGSAADNANASAADDAVNASNEQAASAASLGPSDGLPAQVPDHVSDIHDTIESFLNDSTDNLGQALSDLLSSEGDDTNDEAANGDA